VQTSFVQINSWADTAESLEVKLVVGQNVNSENNKTEVG
jgi:hypothetical protein